MQMKLLKIVNQFGFILEFLLLFLFTVFFDVLLMARFDITIEPRYIIIMLASAAILISALVFIKHKKWRFGLYVAYIVLQLGMFIADSCLYFFKTDLISLAMLLEIGNALTIGLRYNIFVTFPFLVWVFMFLFTILVGFALYYLTFKVEKTHSWTSYRYLFIIVSATILALSGSFVLDTDKTLYKAPEDKKAFFQTFGLSTYHQRDLVAILERIFIYPFEKPGYIKEIDERWSDPTTLTTDQTGLFQGKNVIMIMCETCEMYAFDEDLTPNFYRLLNNSFHFTNAYSAAKLNYTYDAEFKSLVSQMYFKTDNYMYTLSNNTFSTALPYVLKENGYTTNAFHNYMRQFFNRDNIYQGLGFERYYAADEMTFSQHDYWALDSEMFEQMVDVMAPVQDKPFYSFVITLTAHGPHYIERNELAEYYAEINNHPEHANKEISFKTLMAAQMDLDKGLGYLLTHLEENQLIDDTIIVLYSDHKNYSSFDMTLKYKETSSNPHDINKIPYLIFSNGMDNVSITKYTSHYDMTPTIFDLLGIPYYQEYYYGESVFSNNPQKPIIFNYTSWMNSSMIVLENKIVWYDELIISDPDQYLSQMNDFIYQEIILSETILLTNYLKDITAYETE